MASSPESIHNMAQSTGRTNSKSHNDSTRNPIQAFQHANDAAVRAAKDIRDLVDNRDENDLWKKTDETALGILMLTLTIKRHEHDDAWEKMITQKPSLYSEHEFLDAVYNMQTYKGYADIMMNKASHVARRSIIIVRIQHTKGHPIVPDQRERGRSSEREKTSPNENQEDTASGPTNIARRKQGERNSGNAAPRGSSDEEEMSPNREDTAERPAAETPDTNKRENCGSIAPYISPRSGGSNVTKYEETTALRNENNPEKGGNIALYISPVNGRSIVTKIGETITQRREDDPFKSRIEIAERVSSTLHLRRVCADDAQSIPTSKGEDPYISEVLDCLLAKTRSTHEANKKNHNNPARGQGKEDNENRKTEPRTGQGGRQIKSRHTTTRGDAPIKNGGDNPDTESTEDSKSIAEDNVGSKRKATAENQVNQKNTAQVGADDQIAEETTERKTHGEEVYRVLDAMLAEFRDIMEDKGRFHLQPKDILRHDDSQAKVIAWAAEFNRYFKDKAIDLKERGYASY